MMVQYCGGKQRLAPKIAAHILGENPKTKVWVEPFCGMCSVASAAHRLNPSMTFRLSDGNPALVLMLNAIRAGWEPYLPSPEERAELVQSPDPSPMQAWACTQLSYGGVWGGGRVGVNNATKSYEYYHRAGVNTLPKLRAFLSGQPPVECRDFQTVKPKTGVMYVDPPYGGNGKFYPVQFSLDDFEKWAARSRVPTYMSEYSASEQWQPVLSLRGQQHLSAYSRETDEKLFVLCSSPPKQP